MDFLWRAGRRRQLFSERHERLGAAENGDASAAVLIRDWFLEETLASVDGKAKPYPSQSKY